jgi:hypothetical protein
MILYTNSEIIAKLGSGFLNVSLIKEEKDLRIKLPETYCPLIILTDEFKGLKSLLVNYFLRKSIYELVILTENKQYKPDNLINNDVLALLSFPVLPTDLNKVIERYKFRRDLFLPKKLNHLLLKLNTDKFILISDIRFIRAYGNYILVFTSKERIIERIPFSTITKKLPRDTFIQTHRSFMINIYMVKEIKQCSLKIGDDTIPISARKKHEVLKLFQSQKMIV